MVRDRQQVAGPDAGRRVLIVDDDRDLAGSLRDFLAPRGYTVEVADGARRALEIAAQFDAEVALLDVRLGRANGLDLVPALNRQRPDIVCTIITAYADIETAIEALRSGAYDYLRKPIHPDELVATLERSFEKLRLQQEKQAAEEALRESEARLRESLAHERELNKLRSRFVAMVSHEFRTPMTTIMSSCDLLKSYGGQMDEAEKRGEFETIQNEVERMCGVIEQVLTIGRVDAGQLEFRPSHMDLEGLCRDLVEKTRRQLAGRCEIVFTVRDACGKAFADAGLLHHVLSNLLSNAVKYSPDGGRIEVGLSCGGGVAVLQVADQGIGVPEAERDSVFQPFVRASNASGQPGTGLGLAIAAKAVERHGGRITLESRPAAGTVFTVTIPIASSGSREATRGKSNGREGARYRR